MKRFFFITNLLLPVLFFSCSSNQVSIDQQVKYEAYEKMIQKPDFVFVPNNTRSMNGKTINFDGGYSLTISPDTISAYLPYFGRAYSAPINTTEGGIKFISTDFDLNQLAKKKGAYELKITPLDIKNSDLRGIVLFLDVNNSGYANLRLQTINKQPISFYGQIEKRK